VAERLLRRIDAAAAALAWVAAAGIFLLVLAEVIARPLGMTAVISVEYSGYLLAALVFMALGEVTRRGEHITADFLLARMGGRARLAIGGLLASLLTLIYVGVLLWCAGRLALESLAGDIRSQDVSMTPLIYPQVVMVIGLAVMTLRVLAQIVRQVLVLVGKAEGCEPPASGRSKP